MASSMVGTWQMVLPPISMPLSMRTINKIRHFSTRMGTNPWIVNIIFFSFNFVNFLGRTSPTLSNSGSQSIQPEEEPEKIRKWREQQKELIEKKGFHYLIWKLNNCSNLKTKRKRRKRKNWGNKPKRNWNKFMWNEMLNWNKGRSKIGNIY